MNRIIQRSLIVTFAILLIGLTSVSLVSATPITLNAPLPTGGDVFDFSITPDGTTVVYRGDQDTDGITELYSVPIDGSSSPTKLNDTLTTNGHVTYYIISPDSSTVVYRADQGKDDVNELYSVPIDASSSPTKLNGALQANGDVSNDFIITPDGTTVVYKADQDTDDMLELYSVPISGGTETKLNTSLPAGGDVLAFSISPDNSTVVYLADQNAGGLHELFSVPINGGTPATLNTTLPVGGDVSTFDIDSSSSTVVYTADQDTDGMNELYSVPIDDGIPTKLNAALPTGGFVHAFSISSDGDTVVYTAEQEADNVTEVYSVPIQGGASARLNVSMPADGDVIDFAISADNTTVVYRADQETDGMYEVYSVPINGGSTPAKLNGPLQTNGDVDDFTISADDTTVVYMADQDTAGIVDIYSVPITDGTPVKLTDARPGGLNYTPDYVISSDSSTVVYHVDQETDDVRELYRVPIDGGASVKLNGPLTSGGDVLFDRFAISTDSSKVVYLADQDTDEMIELYSVYLVPVAPTNLGASYENSTGSIDLTWRDNATDEVAYTVERSTTGGFSWDTIASKVPADSESYSDNAITCGETYTYRVRARNSNGQSEPSNTAEVSTPGCPPAPPSSLNATYDALLHQVDLSWSDNSDNETGFIIERQKDGAAGWAPLTTTAADATSYVDETVTCDQDYIYRVTATNAAGDSNPATSTVVNTECNLFADVPTDLPAPFMEPWVEDFFQAGITGGKPNCDVTSPGGTPTYCPQDNVTRGEMAVFIVRAMEYPNLPYDPPGDPTDPFVDVFSGSTALPAPFMEDWIEEFYARNITGGKGTCTETASSPDLTYCPKDKVTRGEMAVFILKALGVTPTDDPTDPFVDVYTGSPDLPAPFMEPWIETFLAEGITGGKPNCVETTTAGSPTYCPKDLVTRAEMAVFILRAFDQIPDPDDP